MITQASSEPHRQFSRGNTLILFLVSGLGVLAGGLVGPALPGLGAHFNRGVEELELRLVLTVPALFMAISAALSPLFRAFLSHRSALTIGLLLYAIAGMAGAFAPNLAFLLIMRAMLGFGTGLLMTTTITIIADAFEGEERIGVLAQQSAFMSVSSIFVALLGGILAAIDWRATFAVYGLALLLVWPILRLPMPPIGKQIRGNSVTRVEGLIILILALAAFIGMLSFYLLPMLIPFWLPTIGVTSPAAAGGALALSMAASAAGSMAYRKMRRRAAPHSLLAVALISMALSIGALSQVQTLPWLLAGMAGFGLGNGILLPNLSDTAALMIDIDRRHVAIGIVTMGLFFGQFASSLASKPMLDAGGIGFAFGAAAIALVVAALILPVGLAFVSRTILPLTPRP